MESFWELQACVQIGASFIQQNHEHLLFLMISQKSLKHQAACAYLPLSHCIDMAAAAIEGHVCVDSTSFLQRYILVVCGACPRLDYNLKRNKNSLEKLVAKPGFKW